MMNCFTWVELNYFYVLNLHLALILFNEGEWHALCAHVLCPVLPNVYMHYVSWPFFILVACWILSRTNNQWIEAIAVPFSFCHVIWDCHKPKWPSKYCFYRWKTILTKLHCLFEILLSTKSYVVQPRQCYFESKTCTGSTYFIDPVTKILSYP